ncbi:TauD/TfdA family dioxygenase [Pyxidicoccus trucidator]|uniref:TauD/TfdA family dioxygenase n=1 Tax=Pyxidicoccus trucidator TaxID=2709662 RepID=UPI0013D9F07D|nr:TauD/TfdA family dioxygenase [Pyxidicoccus trucidator]
MTTHTSLGAGFGHVVEARQGESLADLAWEPLFERLRRPDGGAVLLRGYAVDEKGFREFTERGGDAFVVHPNLKLRDYVDGERTYATVNRGARAIDFHFEMAQNPASPEAFWMYCARAPTDGRGRTGLVDGRAVLARLTATTRRAFEERAFRFECTAVAPAVWQSIIPGVTTPETARRWLETFPPGGTLALLEFDEEQRLSYRYEYKAIRPGRICGEPVFLAGLLDSPRSHRFEDGSEIDHWLVTEVRQAVYHSAIWLEWCTGDVLIIDNTRVMHAREAFEDPARQLFVRYSRFRR